MELAPHPDRARRLIGPARLAALIFSSAGKLRRRAPVGRGCLPFAGMILAPSATGAPRGPQRMLTLNQVINLDHALAKLARTIDWGFLEEKFGAV
jgi:hypothetical protein